MNAAPCHRCESENVGYSYRLTLGQPRVMHIVGCFDCQLFVQSDEGSEDAHAKWNWRPASAIEAQRAETTKIGSVEDESAVPNGETPK